MANLKLYEQYFKPDDVPEGLAKLIEFADSQSGWFSQGFELEYDADDVGFKTYSDKPEFLNCLYTIGQADGTGSSYAIWRQDGALDEAPIVAFGSEGGVHIVAENLLGLFRILTLDAEPMISWDGVTYYKSADAEPSEGSAEYAQWLAMYFKLKPVKDAKEVACIIEDAQKIYEKVFQNWLKQFCG